MVCFWYMLTGSTLYDNMNHLTLRSINEWCETHDDLLLEIFAIPNAYTSNAVCSSNCFGTEC